MKECKDSCKEGRFKNEMQKRIRTFKRQKGVFLVEFAFVMPVILTLIIAGFEMARYIRAHQVTNKIAYELARGMMQCINPSTAGTQYDQFQQDRTPHCFNAYLNSYANMASGFLDNGTVVLNARIFTGGAGGAILDGGVLQVNGATASKNDTAFVSIKDHLKGGKFNGEQPRNQSAFPSGTDTTSVAVFTQVTVRHDSLVDKLLNFRILDAGNDTSINYVSSTAMVY